MSEHEFGLDLDKERQSRAAQREGQGQEFPIRLGGQVVATLGPELPLDVLSPLQDLDQELTLLVRTAVSAARSKDGAAQWESTELVIDMLAMNPALPSKMIDVVTRIARGLFGDAGYDALAAGRLSKEDVAALAKGVFRFYGVSLGEASPSSGSSEDSGGTSNGISSGTSGSTPEVSGSVPETPGSLVSAGS